MSLSIDIDKILKSENESFESLLEKVVKENLLNANKGLELTAQFNTILYDAIDFTLVQLDKEEGFLSKTLYRSFGIGEDKNPRRGQLILLGSQLKTQIKDLQRNRHRIRFHEKDISSSIESLTRLGSAFSRKTQFLTDKMLLKKCGKCLKEIYIETDNANRCSKELNMKSIFLESCVCKYEDILKRIPRSNHLEEEVYLEYNPTV